MSVRTSVKTTLTLSIDIDLNDGADDEVVAVSIGTGAIHLSGRLLTEANANVRERVLALLDERGIVVDVCDEGSVLLVHRLIQHPA